MLPSRKRRGSRLSACEGRPRLMMHRAWPRRVMPPTADADDAAALADEILATILPRRAPLDADGIRALLQAGGFTAYGPTRLLLEDAAVMPTEDDCFIIQVNPERIHARAADEDECNSMSRALACRAIAHSFYACRETERIPLLYPDGIGPTAEDEAVFCAAFAAALTGRFDETRTSGVAMRACWPRKPLQPSVTIDDAAEIARTLSHRVLGEETPLNDGHWLALCRAGGFVCEGMRMSSKGGMAPRPGNCFQIFVGETRIARDYPDAISAWPEVLTTIGHEIGHSLFLRRRPGEKTRTGGAPYLDFV